MNLTVPIHSFLLIYNISMLIILTNLMMNLNLKNHKKLLKYGTDLFRCSCFLLEKEISSKVKMNSGRRLMGSLWVRP
jgi:hypothetical protein